MRSKKYLITLLKAAVAVLLVWYLLKSGRLSKESVERLFNPGAFPFLLLGAFAFLLSQALASLRIVFLLRIIGIRLGLFQAFKLTMVGNFFNMVIPGMVGGDIVKGYYLVKSEEKQKGRSSGIVVVDRVLGLLALLMIGAASVVYLLEKGSSFLAAYKHEMRILVVISALVTFSFTAFIFLGKDARVREKIKGMAYRFLKQGFLYNIVEGFGAVTKRRRYPVYAFVLSLVIQMISLAGILVLINIHLDKALDVVPLMAVSSLVMLLGVIPVTPGNIGWTELLATYGWSAVGSNNGAEIFFYWRVVTLLCSLPGGFFYFFPPRNPDVEKSAQI